MTIGQYTTSSGIAGPNEQGTLESLDSFVTGALGWVRIDSWDDSATDKSRVWYSTGEVIGKYMPIYFKVRALSDDLRLHVYTSWDASNHTGSDEVANTTEIQVPNNNASDEYLFFGNKDFIFISIRLDSNGASYLGGAGYWNTFYTSEQDPYPVLVFGQNSANDTFANTARVRSYAYDNAGFLAPASTYSGSDAVYVAQDRDFLTKLAIPNPRDNRRLMLKQDFYTQRSRTDGSAPGALAHEVRGEIPGLYQYNGLDYTTHERLVASGISAGDAVAGNEIGLGDWFVIRSSTTNTYAIGPCVDWEQFPNSIQNIELWLKADAYHLEEGGIRGLVDLSNNTNHATQTTLAQRPAPVASGSNFNDHAVAEFDGSAYLTGTLTLVDSYTVFVVADYGSGSGQDPLFQLRGPVGGDDTMLALEYDSTSNLVQATSRSDDSPLAQDVEQYSGVSSDTAHIISVVVSGTTTTLYLNGDNNGATTVSDTKGNIAGSTELNYTLGATLDATGTVDMVARHTGSIAEVIVYARNLKAEEHQNLVCYLGSKYNITVSGTCV